MPLRLAHYPPVITCFLCFFGAPGSERATAAGNPAATRTRHGGARRSRTACGSAPPVAGGGGRWERQAALLLVLRAFRATAPAELQALLRDEGVAAPDDPVMQELAPLVAAVQTLPPGTRQQLLQLWQDTLQPAVQAGDADAMTDARTPSS